MHRGDWTRTETELPSPTPWNQPHEKKGEPPQ
nr:MAG TPA: hypothetical protein [Caudoviricetes sp.]